MNALFESLYTLSTSVHTNSCKTHQGVWGGLPKMKVGSPAAFLMQQHNPPSTWTGNFNIYQVLNVLVMSRNKHSYRKAVTNGLLSEHLSLDKAVNFSYTSQRFMAQGVKQRFLPTLPSVSASGAALILSTSHRRYLDCQEQLAINLCYRGSLRQLASL